MKKIMLSFLAVCFVAVLFFAWSEKDSFYISLKNTGEAEQIKFDIKESGLYALTIEFSSVKNEDVKLIMQTPLYMDLLFKDTDKNITILSDTLSISGISLNDGNGKIYRDIERFLIESGRYEIEAKLTQDIGQMKDFSPKLKIMKMHK